MQRNWIGRSHGAHVTFPLQEGDEAVTIYTTRVDTLFGATYVAIGPDHPLAKLSATKSPAVAAFIEACKHTSVAEAELAKQDKKGVDTGIKAINPINGEIIPLWIANYVISGSGTGAVMAVPAHDQRDFEFSRQYNLPLRPVIATDNWDYEEAAFTEPGKLIHSGKFNGLDSETAKRKITESLKERQLGEPTTNYRLRDWGISRQRYWGTPIPMINCDDCGTLPVPEKDLPVILPTDIIPTGSGSPLAGDEKFCQTTCPRCKKRARRETDTMDTFVESSWYYARYCCKDQHEAMLDDRAKYWTPVNQYIGGIEHAVMHLLYARFIHKVLRDMGLLHSDEPFTNLLTQGMVLKDGHKMSKSKGNVIAPKPLIEQYGADTVRLFILFAAPPVHDLEWTDSGVEGSHRFIRRVWHITHNIIQRANGEKPSPASGPFSSPGKTLHRQANQLLKQAYFDMTRMQFNTVVSACMKLSNHLSKALESSEIEITVLWESLRLLLIMLTPFTPHITEALWEAMKETGSIHKTPWPETDHHALLQDEVEYVIQVNGKLRARMAFDTQAEESEVQQAALSLDELKPYLMGKTIKRVVVVPKKLINIVII
jgi:leucyl-tRNA synthetase